MTLLLMIYNMLLTNINNHDLGLYHISFFFITFLSHTITDYFTSRINKKLWEKGDTHNFFVFVGLDQILHYFQLFLTYKLLF